MAGKNKVKEEKFRLNFFTILAILLFLLSLIYLGVALLKPAQSTISSVQGKVTVNVVGSLPGEAESIPMVGNVIVNVVPTK